MSRGVNKTTFSVPIIDDAINENSETLTVTLRNPTFGGVTDLARAAIATGGESVTGTITDNDATPSLSINDVTVEESAGTATFTVTLSAVSGLDVTVGYATTGDTATAGSDFTSISGTASIPAGSTTFTFDVTLINDTIDEDSEGFNVTLSGATNATISDDTGRGTILDDD